ncbi:LysR substrate-binding domain-containing protein [Cucumibacter marinus]|uniref:LysR substrate-binding domain-containing protein n=1 Tax=Cucumibacter marinus TaxID=1121252 RepID=UPI000421C09E|nr:LysR substrate-binding domain-containing protein [Cucumibacter marinus]
MPAPLDLDQLQTFAAIADCGSFTEAARRVHKTQSAVSMQIKRLEERLGHPLFVREGRRITLTPEGDELYSRSRRLLRINAEILDYFSQEDLSGTVRFGVPDDYAVRLLPKILTSFQESHPKILVEVTCQPSELLLEGIQQGRFDMIVFTQGTSHEFGEMFRTEPMHFVAGPEIRVLDCEQLPLACGSHVCCWRASAEAALNSIGRDFRVAYTSSSAMAVTSAVMAGLAVGVLPESAIMPDMRVLGVDDGFPRLPNAEIALMRASHGYGGIYDALACHILDELGNLYGEDKLVITAA